MEITMQEMRELLVCKSGQTIPKNESFQAIVVLDRGFVYVGNVEESPDRITISNARNIRRWGTSKGLGELVNGPLSETILDAVGTVVAYRAAVIHIIPCTGF